MSNSVLQAGMQKPRWHFLCVVSLDKSSRIQCQCRECDHPIYAQIHMVLLPNKEIECWGSTCFRHELGDQPCPEEAEPQFPSLGGRPLTEEEREMMRSRRATLIESFRASHQAEIAVQLEKERAQEEERRRLERVRQSTLAIEASKIGSLARVKAENRARQRQSNEPVNDPLYEQVRAKVEAQFLKAGQNLDLHSVQKSLAENAMYQYRREKKPRSRYLQ